MEWFLRSVQEFTAAEYEAFRTLATEERKDARPDSALGEWMVKTALAERFHLPLEEIHLFRTERGKPYTDLPIHFSISHSGDWVAVAISEQPIGIDLEVLRPINPKLTRKVCTEQDLLHLQQGDFDRRFLEIWTAKEAHFKKLGSGITNLLDVSYAALHPTHFYEKGCIITII